MNTLRSMRWAILAAALTLGVTHSAWAATASDADSLTVSVASILSITDEVGNFTITFDNNTGSAAGSISTGQTVGYAVNANNMPLTALNSALTAKLSALLTNIQVRGSTDATAYVNGGGAGNAILAPFNTDTNAPTVIGTTDTRMFDKPATGNKVLKGTAYVNWNAKATADLIPGDGGTVTLTVTLKDA